MGYLGDQEHWYGPGDHRECVECKTCPTCGPAKSNVSCPEGKHNFK